MDSSVLSFKEYNIAGNVLRAYYDSDDKLVFILDSTISDRKPNVLLVINPVGDRKWDDILANDYGVDLETVRPKKDNKYQKLDIEYSGLATYDDLINAYENQENITDSLNALEMFREETVRHAAAERLAVAEANAEKARETIYRTKESINEMQEKLRQLRTKLSQQKKQVGREPTKKSASKILRTDAQIDATNEKLRRAKKRLDNAQRRLIVADEDAEIAREILDSEPVHGTSVAMPRTGAVVRKSENHTNVALTESDNVARMPIKADQEEDFSEDEEYSDINNYEQEAEIMADEKKDEEVKPLFDKDPEILDEEIAFKPIEFGVSSPVESNPVSENPDVYERVAEDKPLSFTPPQQDENVAINVTPASEEVNERQISSSSPVLDTLKSVDMPRDIPEHLDANNVSENTSPVAPNAEAEAEMKKADNATSMARPVPPAATLSGAAAARPVSPITGNDTTTNPAPRKPTLIYYIMLVLLIGLSIFTLWLYQKNTGQKAPDLTETVPVVEVEDVTENVTSNELDSPFIPEIEKVEEPITIAVPVSEPPVSNEKVEPVLPVTEPVAEEVVPEVDVHTVVEDVVVTEPATQSSITEEPVESFTEPVVIPTEEEVLASKPSYNVSQNENMFIAAPEYDTETVYNTVDDSLPLCPDGSGPDMNGCCAGEIYTNLGEMGFNCCPETGGDCFPPLF